MIAIHYFASIRESLGRDHENLTLPADVKNIEGLIRHLVKKNGAGWSRVLEDNTVMVAINHEMTDRFAELAEGDEVAFFPPVTGG